MRLDDDHNDYFDDDDADNAPVVNDAPLSAGDKIRFETDDSRRTGTLSEVAADSKKSTGKWRRRGYMALGVIIVILGTIFYLRYLNPYVVDARTAGYVKSVEKRGIIFRTYEADVISEERLTDTTRVYSGNMMLTVPDESLARKLQELQGTGRKVTIVYEKYYGTLPWRGASTNVITGIIER